MSIKSLIIVFTLVAILTSVKFFGLVINISPSIEEGIYMKVHSNNKLARGDIVAFCLQEPYKSIGLERSYIGKGTICNGSIPLLKKIIAMPGDDVALNQNFIRINGQKFYYQTYSIDSHKRKLIAYPHKFYRHTGGYWVIGDHNKQSWDSRYFGPIQRQQILSKIRPIFIF